MTIPAPKTTPADSEAKSTLILEGVLDKAGRIFGNAKTKKRAPVESAAAILQIVDYKHCVSKFCLFNRSGRRSIICAVSL